MVDYTVTGLYSNRENRSHAVTQPHKGVQKPQDRREELLGSKKFEKFV
jgi:hypothetical protein